MSRSSRSLNEIRMKICGGGYRMDMRCKEKMQVDIRENKTDLNFSRLIEFSLAVIFAEITDGVFGQAKVNIGLFIGMKIG